MVVCVCAMFICLNVSTTQDFQLLAFARSFIRNCIKLDFNVSTKNKNTLRLCTSFQYISCDCLQISIYVCCSPMLLRPSLLICQKLSIGDTTIMNLFELAIVSMSTIDNRRSMSDNNYTWINISFPMLMMCPPTTRDTFLLFFFSVFTLSFCTLMAYGAINLLENF